jgi:hypothetical protein
VDVRLDHRGVPAELASVLEPLGHGPLDHELIDGADRLGTQATEGTVERFVPGHGGTEEPREDTQGEAIRNAIPQLPQIPILDQLQHVGAQRLLGGEAVAPGGGVAHVPHQVLPDQLDHGGLLLEDVADLLQERIDGEALLLQFEVGEARLRAQAQAHGRPPPPGDVRVREHYNAFGSLPSARPSRQLFSAPFPLR